MAESWQELAAAASQEKDSQKLRAIIDKLIEVLGREQKRIRDEIEVRIMRHVRTMEKEGLDPLSRSIITK